MKKWPIRYICTKFLEYQYWILTFWQKSYIKAKNLYIIRLVIEKLYCSLELANNDVIKENLVNLLIRNQLVNLVRYVDKTLANS